MHERRLHGGACQQATDRPFGGHRRRPGTQVQPGEERERAEVEHQQHGERCPQAEQFGGDRGEQRPEDEPAHVEGGLAPQVGAHVLGVAGDHQPAHRRSDRSRPEAEQQAGADPLPQLGGEQHPRHAGGGGQDAGAQHERGVAPVGVAGQEHLAGEARGEPGEGDEPHRGVVEAEPVADVGQEREHAPVPQRHDAGEQEQQRHRPVPGRGRLRRLDLGRRRGPVGLGGHRQVAPVPSQWRGVRFDTIESPARRSGDPTGSRARVDRLRVERRRHVAAPTNSAVPGRPEGPRARSNPGIVDRWSTIT